MQKNTFLTLGFKNFNPQKRGVSFFCICICVWGIFLSSFLEAKDQQSLNSSPSSPISTLKNSSENTSKKSSAVSHIGALSATSAVAAFSAELTSTSSLDNQVGIPDDVEKPIKIGVDFLLNKIISLNEAGGTFEASIDLKLSWFDSEAAFNPEEYGTNRKEFEFEEATEELKHIWNPKIIISNIKDKPISVDQSLIIYADGTVAYVQRIEAVFKSTYSLSSFPFDTQNLKIELISNRYDISEIQFTQSQKEINHSGIREGFNFTGWNLDGIDFASTTIRGINGKYFPGFDVKIVMHRKPVSHLFYFAPLLLIIIIPTIVTLYNRTSDVSHLLTAWSGAILALIALSFTLNLRYQFLPSDSILSEMVATIFAYEFFMICITMIILNPVIAEKISNPHTINSAIRFMRWSVPLVFVAMIVMQIVLKALA